MCKPLVSILIPLYNEEKYIAETITCCLNQTYPNIEVVVVDDHSTDQSLAIAKSFESDRVRVYVNPSKGACTARNYAFEKSKGDYVKYLDSDDYFTDGIIEKQMERMLEAGDEETVVQSSLRYFHMPDRPEEWLSGLKKDYEPAMEYVLDMFRTSKHLWFPLMYLFPRSLVEQTEGWNPRHSNCEDAEFVATVVSKAKRVLFADKDYAVWRVFDDNKHLHAHKETKIQIADILFYLAELILDYKDDQDSRSVCSKFISHQVFQYFLDFYPHLDHVEDLFKQHNLTWMKFEKPHFHLVYKILGWNLTTFLLKKAKCLWG